MQWNLRTAVGLYIYRLNHEVAEFHFLLFLCVGSVACLQTMSPHPCHIEPSGSSRLTVQLLSLFHAALLLTPSYLIQAHLLNPSEFPFCLQVYVLL